MDLAPAMLWGDVQPYTLPTTNKWFDNPLMWQLWPAVAHGDATPTFSCGGSGGTVQDWEGALRKCRANEARFPGARRVENLILGSSQNLTVSPWQTYNVGTLSAAPVLTWNYGSTLRTRVQLNRGTDTAVGVASVFQVITVPLTTAAYRMTAVVYSLTGSINLVFALSNQITNLTVTSTPQRISVLIVASYASAPSLAIGLYGTNSGGSNNNQQADLIIGDVQLELISGQSNTNPGEYIPTGMGSQVFANVDGVRYFGTKLANTMTGNIVNQIAGTVALTTTNGASAMVCDTQGPLGILLDQQQTVAYGIEWDFSAVPAAAMTYATKNVAGPTGDYYGCACIETGGASSAHYLNPYGTLPFATTNTFFGIFVKAGVRTNIQVNFSIGNDTGVVRYTLTGNGSVSYAAMGGSGGGTLRGSGIFPYKDGWYWCWMAQSATAAQTAMNIGIFCEYGGSYVGSGSAAWYLYGLTVMDTGSDPYTFPCQYAAATRGTDTLTFAGNGHNMDSANGTAYAEIKTKWQTSWQHRPLLSGDNSSRSMLMAHGGWPSTAIFMYDGNLAYQNGVPDAFTASRKVASTWNSAAAQMMVTGGGLLASGPAISAFSGTMGGASGTPMGVGWNAGWTGLAMGGQMRNVRIWNVPSANSELAALTEGLAG